MKSSKIVTNYVTDLCTVLPFSHFYSFSPQGNCILIRQQTLPIVKLRNKPLKNSSSPFSESQSSKILFCNAPFIKKKGLVSKGKKKRKVK